MVPSSFRSSPQFLHFTICYTSFSPILYSTCITRPIREFPLEINLLFIRTGNLSLYHFFTLCNTSFQILHLLLFNFSLQTTLMYPPLLYGFYFTPNLSIFKNWSDTTSYFLFIATSGNL